jgi:hypothetical protein
MVETVSKRRSVVVGSFVASLALASACSSSSKEMKPDGAAGGAGTMGAGGIGGGPCDPRTAFTEASHLVAEVTWPAGTASMKGSGQLHVWGKVAYTASGNTLTGMLQACGISLPATTLTALGGGGMIQIEVPNETWEAPSMPRFQVNVTQNSWDIGSTLNLDYVALIGFTMADAATAPWPLSYTGITMTNDAETDNHAGLTAVPRSGTGYTLPPTSILQSARADLLYIVIRQVTSATLTRTACDQASGSATFMHLDNHVIGCHIMGGDDCMPTDVNFIDTNRTIYEITGATAQTKVVAATATCADVRAALPM